MSWETQVVTCPHGFENFLPLWQGSIGLHGPTIGRPRPVTAFRKSLLEALPPGSGSLIPQLLRPSLQPSVKAEEPGTVAGLRFVLELMFANVTEAGPVALQPRVADACVRRASSEEAGIDQLFNDLLGSPYVRCLTSVVSTVTRRSCDGAGRVACHSPARRPPSTSQSGHQVEIEDGMRPKAYGRTIEIDHSVS